MGMRTNIDLDQNMLEEFQELSNSKSKRETVHRALEEAIRLFKTRKLLEAKGSIEWEGNLEEWRSED